MKMEELHSHCSDCFVVVVDEFRQKKDVEGSRVLIFFLVGHTSVKTSKR